VADIRPVDVLLALFSVLVIVAFGYRQFNQWTEAEARGEGSDSELLAFAPPRSFTSHGRFLLIASVYCVTLIVFYALLYLIFRSPPSAGAAFLDVTGVTPGNAWLVALFVVTGLSPILPGFSNIERSVREVMHTWAVVPTKAQQMADELASPGTRIQTDNAFWQAIVLPKLAPDFDGRDFSEDRAVTIAQKWCRLNYLLFRLAPPNLGGLGARGLRSPYTTRFQQDFDALGKEIKELARVDASAVRSTGGSPASVALAERLDHMLHRLYVLMSCRAFASVRSLEAVVQYFRRVYGMDVRRVEAAAFPTDPVFDALVAAAGAVLVVSLIFWYFNPSQRNAVQPFAWAASTLAVHGLGLLVGWMVFSQRKRRSVGVGRYFETAAPISRKYLVASVVLGFSLATIPTLLASIHYLRGQEGMQDLSLTQLAYTASVIAWPWAFLGAATAVAVYLHLERSANREVSFSQGALSGGLQALANVSIALAILAFYNPALGGVQTLVQKLGNPVTLLVLLLTAVIGLVLGLFLPRAVQGYGIDMRGGAIRHRPSGASSRVGLTYMGKYYEGEIQEVSMTGCLLRFSDSSLRPSPSAIGTIVLEDKTALPAQYARQANDQPLSHAFRFTAEQNRRYLPRSLRHRLHGFLSSGGSLVPNAEVGAG
jgi:hypothetical protein